MIVSSANTLQYSKAYQTLRTGKQRIFEKLNMKNKGIKGMVGPFGKCPYCFPTVSSFVLS